MKKYEGGIYGKYYEEIRGKYEEIESKHE